jgi:transposase
VLTQLLAWIKRELPGLLVRWLQDGAKPHIAASTTLFMARRGMETVDHPPQSPDLNPIEKVWAVLKGELAKHTPRTWKGVYAAIDKSWDVAVQKIGKKAIEALPRVMQLVNANPEKHVKNVKY